jgi:hypothetical protein
MTWGVSANPNDTRQPGHMPWGNEARILIEARCDMSDGSGHSDSFYMIAACRTEWMYREDVLFQDPNREYRGIWSQERHISLGSGMVCETGELRPQSTGQVGWVTGSDDYVVRRSLRCDETFNYMSLTLRHHAEVEALPDDEAVVAATIAHRPLVARTELCDEASGMRAVLEYPVRTMNFHTERRRFQVDNGPVIVPDFTYGSEHWIEWLDLAHVVYNRFDRAEFLIRRPTPVLVDGVQVCSVHHFSEVRQCAAQHAFFAVGPA